MKGLYRLGPIARASNPMLAGVISGQGIAEKDRGRLEREYVVLSKLGEGEFSQVYKAREKMGGTVVAVKAGKPYTGNKNRYVLPPLLSMPCG